MGDMEYVMRGEKLVILDDPARHEQLRRANKKKNGRPFQYADSLFAAICVIKTMTGISYRLCEGIAGKALKVAPDHTTIYRRMNSMNVDINGGVAKVVSKNNTLVFAIDSSGLKPSNRGEWIRLKWKVHRGFIKLHILVDVKTQRILSFKLTNEKEGDGAQLPELLDDAIKHNEHLAGCDKSLLADGAYDSGRNFDHCKRNNVVPLIKVRVNSEAKNRGGSYTRAQCVLEQLGGSKRPNSVSDISTEMRYKNQKDWRKRAGYVERWIIETIFSAFKRIFGESVAARKWENIVQEIKIKIAVYNMLRGIAEEVAGM